MDVPCIFLGVKVKPGPIERFRLDNYALENTVDNLKTEAGKKTNLPSSSLELIHHGKILKENTTLLDNGVKNGEMVHVLKKKVPQPPAPRAPLSDAELQQLNSALRTLGCTPNAPGWTRAMQLLNEESVMSEIIEQAPSLGEDCVALSILHEVELLAALGANIQTMRRGAEAHPDLPHALRHLTRLVRSRANTTTNENVPTSGFAYSLEALSEDEDGDDEEPDDADRNPITHEQFAAALRAATEAVATSSPRAAGSRDSLLRLLRGDSAPDTGVGGSSASGSGGGGRQVITPEMFSEAISEAITRATGHRALAADTTPTTPTALTTPTADTAPPFEQAIEASSSGAGADYSQQLSHMHEMGLQDVAANIRALIICAGDVNAAINLVLSGAIDE